MNKTKIAMTVGTVFLWGAVSASYAANNTKPLDQAMDSIDKNLAKDIDNKGLQNAKEHLATNQKRQEANDAKHTEMKNEKTEHPAKPEKVEKSEKAEKAEKMEKVEKIEKFERPVTQHADTASRPEKAGHR